MKSKMTNTDAPQQVEPGSAVNHMKPEQKHPQENRSSTPMAGTRKGRGHFRTWWSEYQIKMKSAFQGSFPEAASAIEL